jgi:hypothetical protein
MAGQVNKTSIANLALFHVGAGPITSIDDTAVKEARLCKAVFDQLRNEELCRSDWQFAIKLAQLPADSSAPLFGKANAFPVPSDFLRLVRPYPEDDSQDLDWVLQEGKIHTDDSAPLEIRYVAAVDDVSRYSPLFVQALALRIAHQLCFQITNSNALKANLTEDYRAAIRSAIATSAIERIALEDAEDPWVTVRYAGGGGAPTRRWGGWR